MTIGDYVDAFLLGLVAVLRSPLTVFALVFLAASVSVARWWFNNYNFNRANAYVKTTILGAVGYLLIILFLIHPTSMDHGSWKIIALTMLGSVFAMVGYYTAALLVLFKDDSAKELKLLVAGILRYYMESLETSASQNPVDTNLENSAMEAVKEVLEEHKNTVSLLLL